MFYENIYKFTATDINVMPLNADTAFILSKECSNDLHIK